MKLKLLLILGLFVLRSVADLCNRPWSKGGEKDLIPSWLAGKLNI